MEPKLPGARCNECPYTHMTCVPGHGSKDPKMIMLGEAPGEQEAAERKPFVGPSGQLLRATLEAVGYDPNDMFYTNVVACRPPGNETPDFLAVEACRGRLLKELEEHMNTPIVALGKTAALTTGVDGMTNGLWLDADLGFTLHTWHPAYVLRNVGEVDTFMLDLQATHLNPAQVTSAQVYPKVIHVTNIDQLKHEMSRIPDRAWVSTDIETNQVSWYESNARYKEPILMMQMAWNTEEGLVLDDRMLYDNPETVPVLRRALEDKKIAGHNFKFDSVFLASHLGLRLDATFDTYLAHYLLNENQKHGLKGIVKYELGIRDYEEELITKYLRSKNDEYGKIPFDKLAQYGVLDTTCVLQLVPRFEERLRSQDMLEWPMNNIIMPASRVLTNVELRGIMVDKKAIEEANTIFLQDMAEKADALRKMCGRPDLNVDSPAQLAEVIYDQYKFPEQNHWKIKPRATAHGAIEKFMGHPFIDGLLGYRKVAKMQRAYVNNLIGFMGTDDRVHADFRIPGTEVGRLSVADPALQTAPRPSEYYGAVIRSLFIPRPGYKLVIADYSQAELRVFAVMTQDPFLIKVYQEGRDLHTEVAVAMFGPGWTKEQRVMCKMFNFSYVYGGNERSFAEDAGLNIDIARQFVRSYDSTMPVAKKWKGSQFKLLEDTGEVKSLFGRRRRFPLITRENMKDAAKASVHMPVASTASDLTLYSAIQLEDEGIPVVLTVHDSVLAEVPDDQAQAVAERMTEVMQNNGTRFMPDVPWKVDVDIKDRWAKIPTKEVK